MKALKEHINEQFVTEATRSVMLLWSHYSPDPINIVLGNPTELKNLEKKLRGLDCNCVIKPVKSNIVCISWNDDNAYIHEIGNNWNAVQKQEISNFASQLDDYDENEDYFELESVIVGTTIAMEEEGGKKALTPETALTRIFSFVKNSEADGDSVMGRAIVDINKRNIIIKGMNTVLFTDPEEAIDMAM